MRTAASADQPDDTPPFGEPNRGVTPHDVVIMARSKTPKFPVTVTQLPLVRCSMCGRMLPHQKGAAADVLTAHYAQAHSDLLGRPDDQD
jgi:hypothetical protein